MQRAFAAQCRKEDRRVSGEILSAQLKTDERRSEEEMEWMQ